MPHNANNVCFLCQVTFKHPGACPYCGRGLAYMGDRWRFPPKKNKKAWERLKVKISKMNPYLAVFIKEQEMEKGK